MYVGFFFQNCLKLSCRPHATSPLNTQHVYAKNKHILLYNHNASNTFIKNINLILKYDINQYINVLNCPVNAFYGLYFFQEQISVMHNFCYVFFVFLK